MKTLNDLEPPVVNMNEVVVFIVGSSSSGEIHAKRWIYHFEWPRAQLIGRKDLTWGLPAGYSTSTLAADPWPREALLARSQAGHVGELGGVRTLQKTGHILSQRPTAIGSEVPDICATLKPFCATHRLDLVR